MGTAVLAAPGVPTASTRTLRDWHEEVRARQRAGDLDGAITLLRGLVDGAPEGHIDRLRHDLVVLLRLAERPVEADLVAVELDPGDARAWARLSSHARNVGDLELSVTASLGWEAAAPDDPVVAHFAAIARSIRDGDDHDRCSAGYVRTVFDRYAEQFDTHLAHLGYRGPQVVAGLVRDLITDGDVGPTATIADLGCGTGLVGVHLRAVNDDAPWTGHLTGVDLAPKMLERAAARTNGESAGAPVYDELIEADLVSFLAERQHGFDVVVAADTLIYLGDLRPAFTASAAALRPGGWLVATVEHAADGRAARRGHETDMTGRFRHDAGYAERELVDAGFDLVVIEELSIRHERRRPVPGLVIVARVPTS